ncbi:MAG TPA: hypothetical protein DIC23_08465 [Planctomycetaceae bacterium]|nr:hypothetical protein [Planctomycetaceae bacterium]
MYNGQRQVMLLAGHDLSRPGNDHRTVSWDRSRWRDRGRLGRFRDQLHRILHHLLGKLAHVSGNLLIVQVLLGELFLIMAAGKSPSGRFLCADRAHYWLVHFAVC